ncbi:hypothetical protein [Thalassobellus suaedae]|uniref:HYR domain-containing protein n=1 Tax=Thalassobellus suaedae TaxID=3074124 RepID=A0ABY9Y339_9FLAO|nr:hypothetical protein RHP49_00005 [Flavobacteriaceae bacterium HL-DH10]
MKKIIFNKIFFLFFILLFSSNINARNLSGNPTPATPIYTLQDKVVSFFVDVFELFNNNDEIKINNTYNISNTALNQTSFALAAALATGDFQSSGVGTGDWDDPDSWLTYDSSTTSWVTTTEYPGENAIGPPFPNVTILTGHIITVTSDLSTNDLGEVIIQGTLILGDNSSNQHTTTLNTQQLTIATTSPEIGRIRFNGTKVRLNLPSNASLTIEPSSLIDGNCTNNDEIFIGNQKYATCVGGGSTTYSFGDIIASGGTINAEITTPPSNATTEACSLVSLQGTYNGSPSGTVNYQWKLQDPNGITTTLTFSISGIISSSSFTPTIVGDYLVSFEVSDNNNTNLETRTVTVTADITDPTFTCPSDVDANLSADCQITIPDLVTGITDEADNCGIASVSQSPASGAVVASSHNNTHTVTITVTDTAGITATCDVTITAKM